MFIIFIRYLVQCLVFWRIVRTHPNHPNKESSAPAGGRDGSESRAANAGYLRSSERQTLLARGGWYPTACPSSRSTWTSGRTDSCPSPSRDSMEASARPEVLASEGQSTKLRRRSRTTKGILIDWNYFLQCENKIMKNFLIVLLFLKYRLNVLAFS